MDSQDGQTYSFLIKHYFYHFMKESMKTITQVIQEYIGL
jgi:hypothetical protein